MKYQSERDSLSPILLPTISLPLSVSLSICHSSCSQFSLTLSTVSETPELLARSLPPFL